MYPFRDPYRQQPRRTVQCDAGVSLQGSPVLPSVDMCTYPILGAKSWNHQGAVDGTGRSRLTYTETCRERVRAHHGSSHFSTKITSRKTVPHPRGFAQGEHNTLSHGYRMELESRLPRIHTYRPDTQEGDMLVSCDGDTYGTRYTTS